MDEILDTIKGKVTGEPFISLWRHFPGIDLDTEKLIKKTLDEVEKFPSSVVKLGPHGRYPVVDFGCEIKPGSNKFGSDGSSKCVNCVIENPEDWKNLSKVDPLSGEYGKQVKFVGEVSDKIEVPVMMTVFSPTMVARKLSQNKFTEHLKSEYREEVLTALKMIEEVSIEFMEACIDVGSDGIFAAVQEADRSSIDTNQINYMIDLNKEFMKRVNSKSAFSVLHLHGKDVAFEKAVNKLQPTAVNWHDQDPKTPNLKQASEIFSGGLFGGLSPKKTLENKIEKPLEQAKILRKEIPLILSPGCVLLQGTTDKTLNYIYEMY